MEERLERLLQRYFDQVLTPEERRELESMLLASTRARENFWSLARWNALLRSWGEAEWGRREVDNPAFQFPARKPAAPVHTPTPGRSRGRFWSLATVAVVLVTGAVLSYRTLHKSDGPSSPAGRGTAVLTRISEAAWAENRRAFQVGEIIPPGWVRLERGAVQIEFSLGARVVLQGPAELQIVSRSEAFLKRGRLSAYVPKPARGFKVRTPEFTVVDHGTEFGCSVASGGGELHVFSGAVSWRPAGDAKPSGELRKNQALRFSKQEASVIPANHAAFLTEEQLARLDQERAQSRLAAWRESSRWLREHPATLVYLDFERAENSSRMLPNRALLAPAGSDAAILGCDFATGRWRGKGALEFHRPSARLRLRLPGVYQRLTLLTWVRVDGLQRRQQALAMSDSFNLGETHWYVFRDGTLGLGVHTDTPEGMHGWRNYHSEPVITFDDFGTWQLLASTCDSTTGVVKHYLNGRLVGSFERGIKVPMRFDDFEIGNWGIRPDDPRLAVSGWGRPGDALRNFQGRMDEFAILSTVLTAQELRRLYRDGRSGETLLIAGESALAGSMQ